MIYSLESARDVLDRFAEITPRDELEIIFAGVCGPNGAASDSPQSYRFLGFDVACCAPFWSPVFDLPPDGKAEVFVHRLNQDGLFDGFADAQAYLEACRPRWLRDPEIILNVWRVWQVPEDRSK